MNIRALMLVPGLWVSAGVSSYAMNYFRAIDQECLHMDFAIYKDTPSPYYEEIKARGCKVWVLPPVKRLDRHVKMCRRILSEGEYNIIHDNTLIVSYPMMLAAVQHRIPVRILHSHSSRLGETPFKERRNQLFLPLLRQTATDFAACSDLAAKVMFGNTDYSFIPNVISSEKFAFSAAERQRVRAELGLSDRIIVGTVARPSPPKNPLFAVKVIEQLVKKNPKVEYWWIGSGVLDEELKSRVEQSEVKDHFRLFGTREDIADLYQAMDVFFLPSRFEGLPVTGVEAQAMGLPCVVSDTVTKECVYTDLIRFVGLNEPIENWVEALQIQIKRIQNRRSYKCELESSVFSERNAGDNLWQCYCRALDKT